MAIFFGFIGVFAGISGALTFVPYRFQTNHTLETAQWLAALSAVGAAVSMAGLVAGAWLFREKPGAWKAAIGAAAGCVGTVALFAATMPPWTPSPVPGGPSAWVFLAVVAAAYGTEAALLLRGRALTRPGPTKASRA